ncbi:MAG: VacJ family lipoprotein [Deltaproteobacteria bacterium]|nr:VacJ family lipoprotein [Deltaproteobacteria bacterium]
MKGWRKVLLAAVFIFAATLTAWEIHLASGLGLRVEGLAVAAGTSNDNGDPFAQETKAVADPLQSFNRAIFQINDKLYFYFWKPIATVYSWYVPCGVRECIRRAFDNARMPVRFVNNLLQCKPEQAGSEVGRFVINSTLGMGGFFDIAQTHFKMKAYDEDFGQTLGVWGAPHHFHIHLPILGPSTLRDTVGLAVDALLSPLFYVPADIAVTAGIRGGEGVNTTSLRIGEYEDFKKSAIDPYISMRDGYIQFREEEVRR